MLAAPASQSWIPSLSRNSVSWSPVPPLGSDRALSLGEEQDTALLSKASDALGARGVSEPSAASLGLEMFDPDGAEARRAETLKFSMNGSSSR
jgi:hypothetical protein